MADKKINYKIPAISLNSDMGDLIYDALQHDRYKTKIKDMIVEYTGTVEFEELIMKYAGKEYDNRILKSGRFWVTTIIATVVTSVISTIIAILITHH